MHIADAKGFISSVIYSPDQRMRITEKTIRELFTVNVLAGIDHALIISQLDDIQAKIKVFSPEAELAAKEIYLT